MLPKLSIVVPVFNTEKFILQCLDSIFQQDFDDLEVVAVNDGSVDKSEQILFNYAKKEPRLRCFSQKNQGVVTARNLGLYNSRGKWIMFVDSDDYLYPECLSKMFKETKDKEVDIVIGNILYDYGLKKIEKTSKQLFEDNFKGWSKSLLSDNLSGGGLCARIYKRDLFDTFIISSEFKIGEDFIASILLFENANKIVLADYCCYGYVQHEASVMHQPSMAAIRSIPIFILWVIDFYKSRNFSDEDFLIELAVFVLNRYYLFLSWGGKPTDSLRLEQIVNNEYIGVLGVRNRIAIWRYWLLRIYRISPILGNISCKTMSFLIKIKKRLK